MIARFALLLLIHFPVPPVFAEVLVFENRAACAEDSRLPAPGAHVMVDAYTAGKWLDSYRQAAGIDAGPAGEAFIEQGLERFRLEFTRLLLSLSEALLSGHLPLLKTGEPPREHAPLPPLSGGPLFGSCRRILGFSSLDSEGALGIPDREWLGRIARDEAKRSENERDCLEPLPSGSSRRYLLRLEVKSPSLRDWNAMGFDFWHSLRAYLFQDWAAGGVFPDLALDQMVVFLPKGCRSLDRPECTRNQISLQQFRSLLAMPGDANQMRRILGAAPEGDLLLDPAGPKQAPRGFPEEGAAEAWLQEVQTHLARMRGMMKTRLLAAASSLELIEEAFRPGGADRGLMDLRSREGARAKLRILCSEAFFALHPEIGKFRSRLKRLKDRPFLSEWDEVLGDPPLRERVDAGLALGDEVLRFCEDSREAGYWKVDDSIATTDYADWYRISALQESLHPSSAHGMGALFNREAGAMPEAGAGEPLLRQERIRETGAIETEVLCSDSSDCARGIIRGLVDLLLVLDWADSLLRTRETALAPNWTNPWTAATACGAYDPGASMRRAWTVLVGDLVSSVLSGFTPVPAWVSVDRPPSSITGWMDSGDGTLSPIRARKRMKFALGMDLRPLTGIPCATLVGTQAPELGLPPIYQLAGVRTQVCSRSERRRVVMGSGETQTEGGGRPSEERSACLVCVASPVNQASNPLSHSLISVAPPQVRLAAGVLVSAVHFSRNLQDPDDVPRRFYVDSQRVRDAHDRHTALSDRCVRRLLKGRGCR